MGLFQSKPSESTILSNPLIVEEATIEPTYTEEITYVNTGECEINTEESEPLYEVLVIKENKSEPVHIEGDIRVEDIREHSFSENITEEDTVKDVKDTKKKKKSKRNKKQDVDLIS